MDCLEDGGSIFEGVQEGPRDTEVNLKELPLAKAAWTAQERPVGLYFNKIDISKSIRI